MTEDHSIGVIGAGTMGAGIAELCAHSGLHVVVCEADHARLESGRTAILSLFDRRVRRNELSDSAQGKNIDRITFSTSLAQLRGCTFVFEAITEEEGAKRELFAELEHAVASDDAVLATNTSSIPVTRLAASVIHGERVIGVHFFNPVAVMPLVEIIPSLLTSERTINAAHDLVTNTLDKMVITAPDQPGFVVNRLLIPFILSAIRMLETSAVNAEVIDLGMEKGCSHPMGPLRLADFIGLDVIKLAADAMHRESGDVAYVSPILLRRLVEANRLGRKTKQGFYSYE